MPTEDLAAPADPPEEELIAPPPLPPPPADPLLEPTASFAPIDATDLRAVVFDVFGTLVDWRRGLAATLEQFGRERRIEADWTQLADAWHTAYPPALERVRSGELPWTNLEELHRRSLELLVQELVSEEIAAADLRMLSLAWRRLDPWPDVCAGLDRLRRRFVVGPLSNGNVALLVDLSKYAGLNWDVVFGADLFQHYKPDPQTYEGVCRLLDLPPGQVMLVAAHNYDLRAARVHGLRTGFVARPTEHGPLQNVDLAPDEPWDVVVSDLGALADQLGA